MKQNTLFCFLLSWCLFSSTVNAQATQSENVFIITVDGVRWQEIFTGADSAIINNSKFVADRDLINQQYWSDDVEERKKKLMPFMWNIISQKGIIMGNRNYGNKMNVSNFYKISYPGYNEIFTGYADWKPILNAPIQNKNINILEYLNKQEKYTGKVVAFSSWNIFPYILNEKRSNILVNSGYENLDSNSIFNQNINGLQSTIQNKLATRVDLITFLSAKEYIKTNHPKVVSINFGEADEYAHQRKYDLYLQQINQFDKLLSELWYLIQTDDFYKNKTSIIITTDHGRGKNPNTWDKHHLFIKGSAETWMAMIGSNISNLGELKIQNQYFQKQIASSIGLILGETFNSNHSVAKAIDIPFKNNFILGDPKTSFSSEKFATKK